MAQPTTNNDYGESLTVLAPGRINLIGEHTDYNMGYVLPAAIDKCITFQFQKIPESRLATFYSTTNDRELKVSLDAIARSTDPWENYLLGILYELTKRSGNLKGFTCRISSDLPIGSGLSSSAALECGLAFGLNKLYSLELDPWDLITLSRDAEHHYVGMQCGIMDQFASVMGRENQVMLLDCRSLEYSHHILNLHPYKFLLLNSRVSHSLAESEYNLRRAECEEALAIIREGHPNVRSLRDLSPTVLLEYRNHLSPVLYNRCTYVLAENERVLAAVQAIEKDEPATLGALLYASHEGLQHRYQVSCRELDFLVDFTREIPDVLGARMMGGGFGGCTLNLIHQEAIETFVQDITEAYRLEFGLQLVAFEGVPSRGVHLLPTSS